MKTTVSIAGASGYTGAELLVMLLRHPLVELRHVYARTAAGKNIADERPALTKLTDLAYEPFDTVAQDDSDVLFIALPHGESQKIVPQFAGKKKIIDLGGDFRLRDSGLFREYYHADHTAPELLANAVYGYAGTQRGHNPDRLVRRQSGLLSHRRDTCTRTACGGTPVAS